MKKLSLSAFILTAIPLKKIKFKITPIKNKKTKEVYISYDLIGSGLLNSSSRLTKRKPLPKNLTVSELSFTNILAFIPFKHFAFISK